MNCGLDFMESGGSEGLPKLNFDRNIHLDPMTRLKSDQRKNTDSYAGSHYDDD